MQFKPSAAVAVAFAMVCATPAMAQTKHETKVDRDTSVHDGVATTTTKVTQTSKHKTRRPRKILGIKVGHKTVTRKTVRETSVSSDGDRRTTVKTSR